MNAPIGKTAAEKDALAIISRRAVETMRGGLDEVALHAARRALVDWTGLMIAGLRDPTIATLMSALPSGEGPALPGVGRRFASHDAALILGAASHVLDYDDTDPVNLVHISSTLFPAIFAVAGGRPVSGMALLGAVVAGYEAESRLGEYLGRPLTAAGWHVTGVIGHFGAALAAMLVQDPDVALARQAMGIASISAGGLIAAFGTMSKSLQVGRAAADGVLAANLARVGFTGPVDCLGSRSGFTRPYIAQAIDDWSGIDDRWGKPFAIPGNSFKPHASCLITHPAIDAAASLRTQLLQAGIPHETIGRVTCRVNPLVPKVAGIARPRTGLEGKFSIGFCVATGLLHGRATPELFTDAATEQDDLLRLLGRTEIVVDPAVGEQQAAVEIEAGSGRFSERTAVARGNPANPLGDDDLSAKFTALAEPLLGDNTALVLRDLWSFEDVGDAGDWFARLGRSASEMMA